MAREGIIVISGGEEGTPGGAKRKFLYQKP
jgi:hypothetical protein